MQKSFWASIVINTDEPLTENLVNLVCEEIKANVAHVVDVHPAPANTYVGE